MKQKSLKSGRYLDESDFHLDQSGRSWKTVYITAIVDDYEFDFKIVHFRWPYIMVEGLWLVDRSVLLINRPVWLIERPLWA